jgi:integrase
LARTALTAITVQKLKPPAKKTDRVERYDAAVPGFGIRVTPEGSRSWIFVYTSPTQQRRRRYTIGIVDFKAPDGQTTLNLEQARARANDLRRMVCEGRDPADERESTRATVIAEAQAAEGRTFRSVVELYEKRDLVKKRRGWEVKQIIERELIPYWASKPIETITAIDVEERVEALVDAGKPAAARRLFEVIRRVFNWAAARPSYKLDRGPADRMKPGDLLGERRKRQHILSEHELHALWRASVRIGYPFGPMIQMLMLTALRLREAAEARWSEFDLATGQWVISDQRMKGAVAFVVPLTAEMVALLDGLPRFVGGGDFLFTADGKRAVSGFSSMKRRLDGLMLEELRTIAEQRGDDPAKIKFESWRLHDIRPSVRSGLSRLKVTEEAREAVLSHVRPGIKGTYDVHDYFDEKKEALQMWGARLRSIIDPQAGNIVALERKQA